MQLLCSKSRPILLTGATGLVGQYVMVELLQRGVPIVALVRGTKLQPAIHRIEGVMAMWEKRLQRHLPRPITVQSDLKEAWCGLEPTVIKRLSGKGLRVLHCGASVRFLHDPRSNEPFASNVTGTQNTIELARAIGASELHFVSTAFVAGTQRGRILEDDRSPRQFNNPYEESKFQAEQLVRTAASEFESSSILRPSIVAGDSRDNFTSTFNTIYSALRFVRALPDSQVDKIEFLFDQLKLSSDEKKNIVFVDWLANAIATIVLDAPKERTATYHLTAADPISLRQVSDALALSIELEKDAWHELGTKFPRLDVGDAAESAFEAFRGYFSDDPEFDRSNAIRVLSDVPQPMMKTEKLAELFRFAIRNQLAEPSSALNFETITEINRLRSQIESCMQSGKSDVGDQASPSASCELILTGPAGGTYSILLDESIARAGREFHVRMSAATLLQIASGQTSLEHELQCGRILMRSTSTATQNELHSVASHLVDRLRLSDTKPGQFVSFLQPNFDPTFAR